MATQIAAKQHKEEQDRRRASPQKKSPLEELMAKFHGEGEDEFDLVGAGNTSNRINGLNLVHDRAFNLETLRGEQDSGNKVAYTEWNRDAIYDTERAKRRAQESQCKQPHIPRTNASE